MKTLFRASCVLPNGTSSSVHPNGHGPGEATLRAALRALTSSTETGEHDETDVLKKMTQFGAKVVIEIVSEAP